MENLQLRLAVGGDERVHPDLYAGLRSHRGRHELVASYRHHTARQSDRSGADAAERARRRQIRHSFPVLVRASFGVRGANLPAVLRALVACGWFGIQTWIGGQAIHSMLRILWPAAASPATVWICFFAFWLLNMVVIWRGIETIRILEGIGAPFMLIVALLLLWWITRKAGGFGPVLSTPAKFQTGAAFFHFFVPSLTAMVGFWATVALNIPDFTRYAKSQRAQALGQAHRIAHGDDAVFVHRRGGDFGVGGYVRRSGVGSGGSYRALSSAADRAGSVDRDSDSDAEHQRRRERRFAFERFFEPQSASDFVPHGRNHHRRYRRDDDALEAAGRLTAPIYYGWLVGYSGLLGPVAGIMIADYFLVRRRRLNVDDLYRRGGEYEYRDGVNPRSAGEPSCRNRGGAIGIGDSAVALALRLRLVCRFRGFAATMWLYARHGEAAPVLVHETAVARVQLRTRR